MTSVRTYRVTPTLWVGDVPMCGGVETTTVEGALSLIDSRQNAVLPHGAWGTVHDVLRALGLDEAQVLDRVHFAQTGSVLTTV